MDMKELLPPIAERLKESATVKTVYGEPVTAGGKTVIPVAKVAYGFGGGSGKEGKKGETEEGFGGGGGVKVSPVGVLEITDKETRFIAIPDWKRALGMIAVGFFTGLMLVRRRRRD